MIGRMLIADDNYYYRQIFIRVLEISSCEIFVALDSDAAVELLNKGHAAFTL